jgi:DMSO reductase anchor subunit
VSPQAALASWLRPLNKAKTFFYFRVAINIMIIGGIDIYVAENELVIHKTKSQKFWQLFWYFLITVLVIGTSVYLIKHKERPAQLDFFSVLIILIIVTALAAVTYLDIRRTIRHNTDYVLRQQNNVITINDEPFSTIEELGDVIIQTISDGDGARSFRIKFREKILSADI